MINSEDKKLILKRLIIEAILFVLLLLGDLLSKDLVMNRLGLVENRQYVLIDGVFALSPCFNDGASFSAFSGKTGFLVALTTIMTLALIVLSIFNMIKKPKTSALFRWALVLIVAGGLGNLYDRVFCNGMVRDFIQYLFLDDLFRKLFHSSFGIGNIADIYLVLGVFLMCGYIIFDYKEGDLGIVKPKNKDKGKGASQDVNASEQENLCDVQSVENKDESLKTSKENISKEQSSDNSAKGGI